MYRTLQYFIRTQFNLSKAFGFQQGQSIEHAITQLIDQINTFENNCFTSGIFIDLSKAFDTLNHKILI